ncbi:Polypeptide N-acetylgalactosaminyltransferase 4 [Toxocara canis]|uniref:Polypeptide N-acetylgalactosaminyltransferase 4 n=1 Tax=Toxocara canis TaxID=6265 RepID=A0A0B2VYR7_TOXCA|nr:Polypeptide N-acetylgalactosaminyltransferase 4 [Toxocara canis]
MEGQVFPTDLEFACEKTTAMSKKAKRQLKIALSTYLVAWSCAFVYLLYYSATQSTLTVSDSDHLDFRAVVTVEEFSIASKGILKRPTNAIIYPKPVDAVKFDSFDHESYMKKEVRNTGENGYAANSFNKTASDSLKWNRNVEDSREAQCHSLTFDTDTYSSTSIVIAYHNEARSTLLRTVMSAFLRSPAKLLTEIILVDDFSDDETVGKDLTSVEKVIVMRNTKREGLMRSRIKGAQLASAPVVTFLDSHCECNVQWLEPLLARVNENPHVVVAPVIDTIDMNTFDYAAGNANLRGETVGKDLTSVEKVIVMRNTKREETVGKDLTSVEKVIVMRNTKREGLMRSRIKGAQLASAPVVTFLDSHCECNVQWLEPLLARVNENPHVVVAPVIDTIDMNTFDYAAGNANLRGVAPVIDTIDMNTFDYAAGNANLRGGFDWDLRFQWQNLSSTLRDERRANPTLPIKTPVMSGSIFMLRKNWFETLGTYDPMMDVWGGENLGKTPVMSGSIFMLRKNWFETLGTYDPMMDVWGGENLEFSFRVWQCGGSLEIIPCSRVGHVFSTQRSQTFRGGRLSVFERNTRRAAEIWLDDYKQFYFARVPTARFVDFGDSSYVPLIAPYISEVFLGVAFGQRFDRRYFIGGLKMVKCRLKWVLSIFLLAWASAIAYFVYYSTAESTFVHRGDEALKHHPRDIRPVVVPAESEDLQPVRTLANAIVYPKPAKTVNFQDFDHESYLKRGALKAGEDRYAANKFNQAASDAIKWNRNIGDSREMK